MRATDSPESDIDRWVQVVAASQRTVRWNDQVVAAHVVLPRRPTHRELRGLRALESSAAVSLSMPYQHDLVIRKLPAISGVTMGRSSQSAHLSGVFRIRPHQPAWFHQLLTMTEGVR